MEHTSNILFSIGPLEVTKTVVTMWVIIVVLGFVSWLATRRLKEVPGPIQSAAEMAVTKLPKTIEMVFPFVMMIAAMVTFWKLSKSNEFVIVRAAGVSIWGFL